MTILWFVDRFGLPGQYHRTWVRLLRDNHVPINEVRVVSLHKVMKRQLLTRHMTRKAPTWIHDEGPTITRAIDVLIAQFKPRVVVLTAPESLACLGLSPEHATLHALRGSVYWRSGVPHLVTLPMSAWFSLVSQKEIGAANYGFESQETFAAARTTGQIHEQGSLGIGNDSTKTGIRNDSGLGQGSGKPDAGPSSIAGSATDRQDAVQLNPGADSAIRGELRLPGQAAGIGTQRTEVRNTIERVPIPADRLGGSSHRVTGRSVLADGVEGVTDPVEGSRDRELPGEDGRSSGDGTTDHGGNEDVSGGDGLDSTGDPDEAGSETAGYDSGIGVDIDSDSVPDDVDEPDGSVSGDSTDSQDSEDTVPDADKLTKFVESSVQTEGETDQFFYEPVLSPVGRFVLTADTQKLHRLLRDGKFASGPSRPIEVNWR